MRDLVTPFVFVGTPVAPHRTGCQAPQHRMAKKGFTKNTVTGIGSRIRRAFITWLVVHGSWPGALGKAQQGEAGDHERQLFHGGFRELDSAPWHYAARTWAAQDSAAERMAKSSRVALIFTGAQAFDQSKTPLAATLDHPALVTIGSSPPFPRRSLGEHAPDRLGVLLVPQVPLGSVRKSNQARAGRAVQNRTRRLLGQQLQRVLDLLLHLRFDAVSRGGVRGFLERGWRFIAATAPVEAVGENLHHTARR